MKEEVRDRTRAVLEQAMAAYEEGKWKLAARLFSRAFLGGRRTPGVLNNLALAQKQLGELELAVASCRMALRLEPQNASIWTNLGNLLRDQHRFEESEQAHRTAISIKPRDAQLHYHLGLLELERARPEEALRHLEGALMLQPDFWQASWDRSLALLTLGKWQEAWPGYALRWKLDAQLPPPPADALWDGRPHRGTVVVHHEQGLGDTLMAARYLPWVAGRCDRVVVKAPATLHALLREMGVEPVAGHESLEGGPNLVHTSTMELLRLAEVTPESLEGKPYLRVPATYRQRHAALLPAQRSFLRVGIVWSGSTTFVYNHHRSMPMEMMLRLMEVPQVKLMSLQMGEPAQALEKPGMKVLVKDLSDQLEDMADTAAVMQHLDLLVTTDTSVAHLAGALGVNTWLLLAHRADWRWLGDARRTGWYDSVRLFRQGSPGDWDGVMRQVVQAVGEIPVRKS